MFPNPRPKFRCLKSSPKVICSRLQIFVIILWVFNSDLWKSVRKRALRRAALPKSAIETGREGDQVPQVDEKNHQRAQQPPNHCGGVENCTNCIIIVNLWINIFRERHLFPTQRLNFCFIFNAKKVNFFRVKEINLMLQYRLTRKLCWTGEKRKEIFCEPLNRPKGLQVPENVPYVITKVSSAYGMGYYIARKIPLARYLLVPENQNFL